MPKVLKNYLSSSKSSKNPLSLDKSHKCCRRNFYSLPIIFEPGLRTKRYDICCQESDVITKLVMEKFKHILNYHCQRSSVRSKFRKKPCDSTSDNSKISLESTLAALDHDFAAAQIDFQLIVEQNKLCTASTTNSNLVVEFKKKLTELQSASSNSVAEMDSAATLEDQEEVLRQPAEETIEYDADEFLKTALGDELYSSCSIDSQDVNIEVAIKSPRCNNGDYSIDTTDASLLISNSSSLYGSFAGKLHQHRDFTSSPADERNHFDNQNQQDVPVNSEASLLIQEGAVQHHVIVQISKALNICLNSKEFRSSTEYVEAEKILLLAVQKREAVISELRRQGKEDVCDLSYLGEVEVSDITFTLEQTLHKEDSIQWFVAIVSSGTEVFATNVTTTNEGSTIEFQKSFKFTNLNSNFEITIRIYALNLKKDVKMYSHESKFHIPKETTMCPTPNKLIEFYKTTNRHKRKRYSYERREPSFVLWGVTNLNIADLIKGTTCKLRLKCETTRLQNITVKLSSNVHLKEKYSGFLTIGTEGSGFATWNRRWCCLDGHKLKYWSYPADEEFTEPIGTIDLSFSITSCIRRANRELCARPRTLLVEIGHLAASTNKNSNSSNMVTTRYYLSADNIEEMRLWDKKINYVVSRLRNWNCMKW